MMLIDTPLGISNILVIEYISLAYQIRLHQFFSNQMWHVYL